MIIENIIDNLSNAQLKFIGENYDKEYLLVELTICNAVNIMKIKIIDDIIDNLDDSYQYILNIQDIIRIKGL